MQRRPIFLGSPVRAALLSLFWIASTLQPAAARPREGQTETIVMVRHGEKTAQELGQLSCKGLNRALALPDVLTGLYGKPDFIYAPNPSVQVYDRNHSSFSYVRPLITIEPTAIRLGMSVNTQIGFNDIEKLQQELMQPAFADALIFVAWEHNYLYRFARQMLRSNGKDPSVVLEWPSGDYDTIYVLRIRRSYGMPQVSFTTAKEMLDDAVSDSCPTVR